MPNFLNIVEIAHSWFLLYLIFLSFITVLLIFKFFKKDYFSIQKIILFLTIGLVSAWIVGIILVNSFNLDVDHMNGFISSNFFMNVFLATAAFILFLLFLFLIREKSQEGTDLSDKDRRLKIIFLFITGVSLPIGLSVVGVFLGTFLKSFSDPKDDTYVVTILGTLISLTGLPFIIRMLRLIRNEFRAIWVALLLVPYGLMLWIACLLLMLLIFQRGSCC